jgi:hypothetical protein
MELLMCWGIKEG